MRSVQSFENFFEGAVSIEHGDGWVRPWRLPHDKRLLFPSPDDGLLANAGTPSAVRLRLRTPSQNLKLCVVALGPHATENTDSVFDVVIDNQIVASTTVPAGTEEVLFSGLPSGDKVVELWLPPGVPVMVRDLQVDDDASCVTAPDERKRWVTYGSSLTHCVRANSAARVWPAIVARRCNLHVTSLGFGGQCHMDPMVALVIRDLPADFISLKLGINILGGGTLNRRTFAPAMIGLIQIIREKHPTTPIALVTSFCCPPRESTPNPVGMTLEIMREQTTDVYNRLIEYGDTNLTLCDGTKIVDHEAIQTYAPDDQLHHNGDGIEDIGDRWMDAVMRPCGFAGDNRS